MTSFRSFRFWAFALAGSVLAALLPYYMLTVFFGFNELKEVDFWDLPMVPQGAVWCVLAFLSGGILAVIYQLLPSGEVVLNKEEVEGAVEKNNLRPIVHLGTGDRAVLALNYNGGEQWRVFDLSGPGQEDSTFTVLEIRVEDMAYRVRFDNGNEGWLGGRNYVQ